MGTWRGQGSFYLLMFCWSPFPSFFLSAFSLFLRFTFLLFWLVKACRNWTELNLFSNSKILRKIFTIPLSYLYDDRSVYQLTRITKLRYETKIKFVKKKKKKNGKHHNNLICRSAFRAPSGINYKLRQIR